MDILKNIIEPHIFLAFIIGLVSAVSLPLGTITSAFWKPGDRAMAFLMAGGRALMNCIVFRASQQPFVFFLVFQP
jgi:hypothetical protein